MKGIRGILNGRSVIVGSPRFGAEHGIKAITTNEIQAAIEEMQKKGQTVIVVGEAQCSWDAIRYALT